MNQTRRAVRVVVALLALGFLLLFGAAARRYSTLIESLMQDPAVSEWQGPAQFRLGVSPDCQGVPCWARPEAEAASGFVALDVPRVPLGERLKAAGPGDRAWYRFLVTIPPAAARGQEQVAFSPNWVVHRSYQIYVDGAWVGSGNGVDAGGDIIYQKVVVLLSFNPNETIRFTSDETSQLIETGPIWPDEVRNFFLLRPLAYETSMQPGV